MSYEGSRRTFTVFTPSYNRASLLPRLYESLKTQTLRDFEWLVVDDGSTDGTKPLVEGWIGEGLLEIRYLWKPNGGKHTAINLGVREAEGFFFAIMDSDDWYEDRALERILFHWESIPREERHRFTGACGHFAYESGAIVGSPFPGDVLDTDDIELRIRHGVEGDKIGATRLSIMREFPFPEDLGSFVTESLVWHRIGSRYLTRFVNEVFALKEYQEGGLTDRGRVLQARNSKASLQYYREFLSLRRRMPFRVLVRGYANYVRHSLHEGIGLRDQAEGAPSLLWWSACLPIGFLLSRKDRRLMETEASPS